MLDLYAGPTPKSKAPEDGLNKLERAFKDEVLEPSWVRGSIRHYWREPFRMVLAGGVTYRPDFMACVMPGEQGLPRPIAMLEVKGGFFRDDAKVKIKVASSLYQCFEWFIVFREGRHGWDVHRVTALRGIEREPVYVPWIHGV